MKNLFARLVGLGIVAGCSVLGCSESAPNPAIGGTGGGVASASSGGATGTGGVPSTGGVQSTGGATGSGGSTIGSGGATGTGGTIGGSGGANGTGGKVGAGGTPGPGAGGTVAGAGGAPVPAGVSPNLITATHADGYLQLFPASPVVAIGPWFTYNWGTSNCNIAPKSGAQVNKGTGGICFSGQSCTGTAPGAGLGVKICTTPGDISTWTEMQTFMAGHGMTGTNAPYGFGQCNTGNKITAINWVGNVPAGAMLDLHDAADLSLMTLPVPAGATSISVPATLDGGKIASIHFTINGSTIATWNFCVSSLTLAYQ